MKAKITGAAILVLVVLALSAAAVPLGVQSRPLQVDNITIQHYPQGRGVDCTDPYGDIEQDWHIWEYIQSDSPNVRFDDELLDPDCESHIIVTYGGAPPTITYRSKINYRLAETVTFTSSNNLVVYMPQEDAGDCWNEGYPPYGFGDNVVGVDDYNLLYGTFGRQYGDPLYVDRCDFDGDGAVTVADFNMLYTHFGQEGSPSLRLLEPEGGKK